jgi:hypothetical protein
VTEDEAVPAKVGVTRTCKVAVPRALTEPKVHVITPPAFAAWPWDGTIELTITPAGRTWLRMTDLAVLGPAFVSLIE